MQYMKSESNVQIFFTPRQLYPWKMGEGQQEDNVCRHCTRFDKVHRLCSRKFYLSNSKSIFFQLWWHRFGGNHLERASFRMVEDNSGLGYKFQSSRRKGSSGNRVRREKVEKWKVLLKQGCCWIHEKRWWVVIISGVSLVIVSVSILGKDSRKKMFFRNNS